MILEDTTQDNLCFEMPHQETLAISREKVNKQKQDVYICMCVCTGVCVCVCVLNIMKFLYSKIVSISLTLRMNKINQS